MKTLRGLLLTVVVIASIATTAIMGFKINRELHELRVATTDNLIWSSAQLEVDLLQFRAAVDAVAHNGPTALPKVRRNFDIAYSRVVLLEEGRFFDQAREQEYVTESLGRIREFIDTTVTAIDGEDAGLLAALPTIEANLEPTLDHARELALVGVKVSVKDAQERRLGLGALIWSTGLAMSVGFAGLLLAVMLLARQWRLSHQQARENSDTNSRLSSVIGVSLDAILIVDKFGKILDFNGAASKIFGHAPEDVIGRDIAPLLVPEQHRKGHQAGMDRYRRTGGTVVTNTGLHQLSALHKDGREIPIELSISSAETTSGTIFVSYIRDISHRLKVQTDLTKARDDALAAERARADFIAIMSHEMRTPLNGVISNLELLSRSDLTDRQKRHLAAARTSGEILLHHANDVLDLSKIESGQFDIVEAPMNLDDMLNEVHAVCAPFAEDRGNRLTIVRHDHRPARIIGDRFRLQQVLMNLVGNAIKFTQDGQIEISVRSLSEDCDPCDLEFEVSDTGVGMDPKALETIFDNFVTLDRSFRREADGAGLGLSICRRLIEKMGSSIKVRSEPGKGSAFSFAITFGASAHESSPAMDPGPETAHIETSPPAEAMHVLVVEDNEMSRDAICEMLQHLGHRVSAAENGDTAVSAANNQRFDLILMDISMPVMDGVTATEQIRASMGPSSTTAIAALSAHVLQEELSKIEHAGFDQVLSKPIRLATLEALLAEVGASGSKADVQDSEPASCSTSALDELRECLGNARFRETLERAIGELRDLGEELLLLVEQEQCEAVAHQAHKLAGLAATFGLTDLHARLGAVCAAAGAGDLTGDLNRDAFADIRVLLDNAVSSLAHHISEDMDHVPDANTAIQADRLPIL